MTRQAKTKKLLIGRSGNGRSLAPLVNALEEQGYQVTERPSPTIGAHDSGRSVQELVNEYDMVFLVVRERDGLDTGGPLRPYQQLLREAGVMQGKLGMNRVVLLVENTVDGLSRDSGVGSILFPPERPGLVLNEVLNKIGAAFPRDERNLHEREPIADQARSAALRVPWLLVGVVLLAAAIPLIVALSSIVGDGGGTTASSDEMVTMSDVGKALTGATAAQAPEVAPPVTAAEEAAGPATGVAPSGPDVTVGGANEAFPASCTLDLRKGSLLDDAVICEGAGRLQIQDRDGPWHNDLAAIVLGDGVVGELRYEAGGPRADDRLVVELGSGLIPLDLDAAAFGVQEITLRFSANNQHVHLLPRESVGGQEATLTFTLDR